MPNDDIEVSDADTAAIRAELVAKYSDATSAATEPEIARAANQAAEAAQPASVAPVAAGSASAAPAVVPAAAPATPSPVEAQLAAVMAKLMQTDADNAALRKRLEQPAAQAAPKARTSINVDDLRYRTIAALEEAGVSKEFIAQQLVASHLGDAAPAEFKAQAAFLPQLGQLQNQMKETIAPLQAQLAAYEARERAREYEKSLQVYVSEGASEYPLIAQLAKSDAAGIASELKEIALDNARQRQLAGESGPPMTAVDAAKILEGRYALVQKRLAALAKTPDTTSQNGVQLQVPKPVNSPATMAALGGVPSQKVLKTIEEEEADIVNDILRKHQAQT